MVVLDIYPKNTSEKNKSIWGNDLINQIFEMTYIAMIKMVPSNNSKEEDSKQWKVL